MLYGYPRLTPAPSSPSDLNEPPASSTTMQNVSDAHETAVSACPASIAADVHPAPADVCTAPASSSATQ